MFVAEAVDYNVKPRFSPGIKDSVTSICFAALIRTRGRPLFRILQAYHEPFDSTCDYNAESFLTRQT